MLRCCRMSNSRTSARAPPRPPPPKFVVFMTFKLPAEADEEEMYKLIIKWTKDFRRENERLPSSFELRKYVEKKNPGNYDSWEDEYHLELTTSHRGATRWQLAESIDDYIDYRSPSPPPQITEQMYYCTRIHGYCHVCLNDTNSEDSVALSTCHCIYHKSCIEKSYNYSNKCPVCGKEIEEIIAYEFDFDNPVDIVEI